LFGGPVKVLAVGWLTTSNGRSRHHVFGSKRFDEMMPFLSVPFQWMEGGPYRTFRIHHGRLYVFQTHGDTGRVEIHQLPEDPREGRDQGRNLGRDWAARGRESTGHDENCQEPNVYVGSARGFGGSCRVSRTCRTDYGSVGCRWMFVAWAGHMYLLLQF